MSDTLKTQIAEKTNFLIQFERHSTLKTIIPSFHSNPNTSCLTCFNQFLFHFYFINFFQCSILI